MSCDCYPYSASSSTLDKKQITDEFDIVITWSTPHPEVAGRKLAEIAADWSMKLQEAGAIYYNMDKQDVRRVLSYPVTMIGSDGLQNDPIPYPRLWGAFPRVLGHYSREEKLFPLTTAIHKMTGLSAARFNLPHCGLVRESYFADLVLFDPQTVAARATFAEPQQPAVGDRNGDGEWHYQLRRSQRRYRARRPFSAPRAELTRRQPHSSPLSAGKAYEISNFLER